MAKIVIQRSPDGAHTTGTDEAGNSAVMYLPEGSGGNHTGIRPMQMLLMGMGGCSAVDVLSILKKQRQEVDDLRIEIDAEREAGKEPSIWEKAHLRFFFKGRIDAEKAQRAVDLSMQKYCSASETLRRAGSNLSWEVILLP